MVDPAASTRFTGQSTQLHLRSENHLSSFPRGVAVRVFVEEIGTGGSVVLRLKGKRVPATTAFPLRKGAWYVVRRQQAADRISLRIESKVSRTVMPAEIARSAGLPSDAISEAVVRAFIRTGLPLLPERLQHACKRVIAAFRGKHQRAGELARFEALSQRKGLFFGDDVADVVGWFGGHGPSDGGDSRDTRAASKGDGRKSGTPGNLTAAEVRRSFRLSAQADHPIHLFNHVVGEGDHWVVVPINAPGCDLEASLRIRIPRGYALGNDRSLPAVREAVLLVLCGETRWLFGLQPTGSGLRVVLLSRQGVEGSKPEPGDLADSLGDFANGLDDLANRLRDAGMTFDLDPLSASSDDGFSQTDGPDIITSVDGSA